MITIASLPASTVHQWFFSGVGGTAAQAQGDMLLVGVAQCRAVVSHFQVSTSVEPIGPWSSSVPLVVTIMFNLKF